MITEKTLREAIDYITKSEDQLISLHVSLVKAGQDEETRRPYFDTLINFLEVRKHIYELHSGASDTSPFLKDMTGQELVQHFAEWDGQ